MPIVAPCSARTPEVLEVLRSVVATWPIREDVGWAALWPALGGESRPTAAIPVRLGILEVLHEALAENEWIARLDHLASLEGGREALEGLTQAAMGGLLVEFLGAHRAAALLLEPIDDSLQRAILLRFPAQPRWPQEGHGMLGPSILEHLRELRDSVEFPHRFELLQRQWTLLGPAEALADLERHARSGDTRSPRWERDSAIRIRAALGALEAGSAPGVQGKVFVEQARETLGRWLRSLSEEDLRRLGRHLQASFWSARTPQTAALLTSLAEILTAEWLESLPGDIRRDPVGN